MNKNRKLITILSVLALIAVILTGCGKKDEPKSDVNAGASQPAPAQQPTTSQPALSQSEMDQFRASLGLMSRSSYEDLEGVPLYVGSAEIDGSRSLTGSTLTASYSIIAKVDEFTTFYERELPNFGWSIVRKQVTDDSVRIEATKSGRLASIAASIVDGQIKEYKIITD